MQTSWREEPLGKRKQIAAEDFLLLSCFPAAMILFRSHTSHTDLDSLVTTEGACTTNRNALGPTHTHTRTPARTQTCTRTSLHNWKRKSFLPCFCFSKCYKLDSVFKHRATYTITFFHLSCNYGSLMLQSACQPTKNVQHALRIADYPDECFMRLSEIFFSLCIKHVGAHI